MNIFKFQFYMILPIFLFLKSKFKIQTFNKTADISNFKKITTNIQILRFQNLEKNYL